MADYRKIIKDCFWDYDMTESDIKNILASDNKQQQKKLFDKIIYNSNDKISDLMLFDKKVVEEFLNSFTPSYNKKYINKHLLVLKALILNEGVEMQSLKWLKR